MKQTIKYKGHAISFRHGYYWTLGKMYTTLRKAKAIIDKQYL